MAAARNAHARAKMMHPTVVNSVPRTISPPGKLVGARKARKRMPRPIFTVRRFIPKASKAEILLRRPVASLRKIFLSEVAVQITP
jgi:hypothetical protein